MRTLFFIFFFILTSLSLEAYSKKIIMASFSTQERANKMMAELPTRSPTLYKLSKKYGFAIKMRESGKYYVLVAEVFTDRAVLNKALKSVRKIFKGSYVGNYKVVKSVPKTAKPVLIKKEVPKLEEKFSVEVPPVVKEVKKVEDIEIKETSLEPKIIQKKIKEEVKTLVISNVTVKENETSQIQEQFLKQVNRTLEEIKPLLLLAEEYFQWYYLVLLFLLSTFTFYYIKFKKIYDEY